MPPLPARMGERVSQTILLASPASARMVIMALCVMSKLTNAWNHCVQQVRIISDKITMKKFSNVSFNIIEVLLCTDSIFSLSLSFRIQ